MKNIPCEVVQDLLPSYIDGLTSDVTNKTIEDHLDHCEKCSGVLASMRGDMPEEKTADPEEKAELDFLKKNRKKNIKVVLGSLALAAVVIFGVIFIRMYIVGDVIYGDWIYGEVAVDGKHMTIDGGVVDSVHAVSKVTFTEEEGVVTLTTRAVLASPLHRGRFHAEYTAQQEIRQVKVNDRILWDEGENISSLTSAIFETRHDFIGDMPANQRTANVLFLSGFLGEYTNELETEKEPYGWHFHLTDAVAGSRKTLLENDMESFSYVLLGVIGNLDHVTFHYTAEGEQCMKTVTAADASSFFGRDIKDCGTSVRALEALLDKTGLMHYAFGEEKEETSLGFSIVNDTPEEISYIEYAIYRDGQLVSSGGGMHADESLLARGEVMDFMLEEMELGDISDDSTVYELEISVSVDGKSYPAGKVRLPSGFQDIQSIFLTGSAEKGFAVSI